MSVSDNITSFVVINIFHYTIRLHKDISNNTITYYIAISQLLNKQKPGTIDAALQIVTSIFWNLEFMIYLLFMMKFNYVICSSMGGAPTIYFGVSMCIDIGIQSNDLKQVDK